MTDNGSVSVVSDPGNTKKPDLRSRGWFFTWNNPGSVSDLLNFIDLSDCTKYVFQLEQGDEGTPHFQGFVYFKNQKRFSTMKKLCNEVHWEVLGDLRKAIRYCCKLETRIDGPWSKGVKLPREINLINPDDREWQRDLLAELQGPIDDRKVIWYSDPVGNAGKTSFAKYLCVKHKALYVQGKATDIKYGMIKFLEKGDCDIVIFGFPRTYENFVSYDAIESLKDGIFYSTKYESGMCIFPTPHVVILANFEPDLSAISKDRWDIRCLSKEVELTTEEFLCL